MPTAKKRRATFFWPTAKNVAPPKSRVALRATSLAAAVAQNGYFDPNVAPAQQLILALVHTPYLSSPGYFHLSEPDVVFVTFLYE